MKTVLFFLLSFCLIFNQPLEKPSLTELSRKIPDKINLWSAESDVLYHAENLYQYINGGAELYLTYGFRQLISRKYRAPDLPPIYLDLFDMGDTKNAFGLFCHSREYIDRTFGQGSQVSEGQIIFWKNNYYVSLLCSPETVEGSSAIRALARQIEKFITSEGVLPKIVSYLPEKDLIKPSIRYFHHPIWINSYYFIAEENIFKINEQTEAVLAKYRDETDFIICLLVQYPDQQQALSAKNSFMQHYLSDLDITSDLVRTEDDKWLGWLQIDNLIGVIFNSKSKEKCKKIVCELEQIYQYHSRE